MPVLVMEKNSRLSRVNSKVRHGISRRTFTTLDLKYCAVCTALVPAVNLATGDKEQNVVNSGACC